MDCEPDTIRVEYNREMRSGTFAKDEQFASSVWGRLKLKLLERNVVSTITDDSIEVPWPDALGLIREFGTKASQKALNFRFSPVGEARDRIQHFVQEVRHADHARGQLTINASDQEVVDSLIDLGFKKRSLKSFQVRDLEKLLSMSNGANFSVPGAGKTTVTFALHMLTRQQDQHLLVVAPKSALTAWRDVVDDCVVENPPSNGAEPFTVLTGGRRDIEAALYSGATRFLITYDLMIRQQAVLSAYLARKPVHLVLDESHRMKAGWMSQRGAYLLNISYLPIRRDILSGTPMPQGASDLASQLGFLWPGVGLDYDIQRGKAPKEVLGNLYVRTTKQELGLPPVKRIFYDVDMSPGQLALYSVVRNEALRQFARFLNPRRSTTDYVRARKSVMRLLQLSVNPTLALTGMANDDAEVKSGIVDEVLKEGLSNKLKAVIGLVRRLAADGRKAVIWTIFTDTIRELEAAIADMNPVVIHGSVPTGEKFDIGTREGRLERFHVDANCHALIANPAAAGEGISLHTVCHDAIYADRSYVSTHYLQSIERVHRLGLPENVETNIYIFRTRAPAELGSVDLSVSRRLASKIRNMQMLLDDPDLHELALDEEGADDPIDYEVNLQDIKDLVAELEGRMIDVPDEAA